MGCPTFPGPEAGKLKGAGWAAPRKLHQATVSVAGSTFTPGPWVEEMAIFLR
jgi:hypothetical protein